MERSEVDFVQLVHLLLAGWDGSAAMAAQIRRAVLKAARHIAPDGWRRILMSDWQALAEKLRPTVH